MSISHYIKEIGRGKQGARHLSTEQARNLMENILSDQVSELELGAFCIAMRIKGETPEEMVGFLQAMESHMEKLTPSLQPKVNTMSGQLAKPVIVIPSYNGARKLPNLTPLLAGALALQHYPVLVHGYTTEDKRVSTEEIFKHLNWRVAGDNTSVEGVKLQEGEALYISMKHLSPKITDLLDIRKVIGLRNSSHSLVKILNPIQEGWPVLQLSSYTHPEYLESMSKTFELLGKNVLFLRGTEGEAVADPRRTPKMTGFVNGQAKTLVEQRQGTVESLNELPPTNDPKETSQYIQDVLQGAVEMPSSISAQISAIEELSRQICTPITQD